MESETLGSFYRAAHVGLRVLDARGARRRFGPEADELWKQLRGDMTEADRLDLLLKDAATVAPLAFAPRDVFVLRGLSREDPYGPSWEGPPRGLAGELLRAEIAISADPLVAFDAAAAAWDLTPARLDPASLPRVSPNTRVVAGGLAALRALVAHFAAHRDSLDLADQVLLVADRPVERHLFGLAAVFLGLTNPPRVVAPATPVARVHALGFTHLDARVVSGDASAPVRETVGALADTLAR